MEIENFGFSDLEREGQGQVKVIFRYCFLIVGESKRNEIFEVRDLENENQAQVKVKHF